MFQGHPKTHLIQYGAYSMASSWVTTPHPRPSFDTVPSESHPGLLTQNSILHTASSQSVTPDAKLAHERAGPFAISAAQICVKIGEDRLPSLPSNVVFEKRPTPTAPAVVTSQVKGGPPALSDVHTDVFAASPSLKHKQVARLQSPSSSSTFERQTLASVLTTNSQTVAPISAASNLTPPLTPHSPEARPTSTTDISTTSSPTTGYSQLPALNQSLNRSPNLERGAPGRQPPKRSGTSLTFGTNAGNSIAQTEYTDMVFEEIPFHFDVMTCIFMWIVLAGFLILPTSFPELQTILQHSTVNSDKLTKVVRVARNIPLYVSFFPPVPLFKPRNWFLRLFFIKLTRGIKSTDLSSASPAASLARSGCVTSGGASDTITSGFSAVSSCQGCSMASLA